MATPQIVDWKVVNDATPDYLEKSYAGQLIRFAPNGMAPLFALTSMFNSGTALSVEHGYFSKTMVFPSVQINNAGGYNSAATSITVDTTANILAGDMLRVQASGEIVRVTSVDSSTALTIVRAVGQVAAASIADDAKLYGVGNAFEQASNRPASRLIAVARVLNNTQIFRNSWALSHTLSVIRAIVGEGNIAEGRMDCGMFHAADIEKAILFGQKSSQVVSNQLLTTMDGLVETTRRLAPAANTTTAGATTTFTQLETALNPCFETITNGRNGNERVLFVGGSARTVINNIGRLNGTYQLVDGQTNFGLQFSTFKTSRGMFRMIEHPLLNSNDDWKKMAIAVDMPSIRTMYLAGRKTQNIEYGMDGRATDNGQDAVGGTLTTEMTMEITNPGANAVIYGLTAAAVG